MQARLIERLRACALGAGCLGLAAGCVSHLADAADASMKSAADLAPDRWNELATGGDTACAKGAPYSFFVHPGTTENLVIDFAGGGACWDEATCRAGEFTEDVSDLRRAVRAGYGSGIYDRESSANPFANDWHVLVPYCTGDVHWGDAVVTYGHGDGAFTIHHEGAANARAVLHWVFEQIQSPSRVLVTGCSAGAYGAALWSSYVMREYPDVPVVELSDSGAAVITDRFLARGFPSWNAAAAFPSFVPGLDPKKNDVSKTSVVDFYSLLADHFPNDRFLAFDHTRDASQIEYFAKMGGGDAASWTRGMLSTIRGIHQRTVNYASFTVPGTAHCITPSDEFYAQQPGGVRFVDWLASAFHGPVESIGEAAAPPAR
jgi:hypothetical protein